MVKVGSENISETRTLIRGVRFLLTGSKHKVVVTKIADSYYLLHVTLPIRRSSTDALTWTKITGNINSSSSVIMFYTVDYRKYEFLNDQTVYCRGFDRVSIPTHCQIGKCRKFTKQPTFNIVRQIFPNSSQLNCANIATILCFRRCKEIGEKLIFFWWNALLTEIFNGKIFQG